MSMLVYTDIPASAAGRAANDNGFVNVPKQNPEDVAHKA